MGAIIHTISAQTFANDLTNEQRTGFLADIAAEWVDAGEDGSVAMPTSYALLFERRVAQAAKMAEAEPEAKMTEVLTLAAALAEEGDLAFAFGPTWAKLAINAADEDDEVDEEEDAEPVETPAAAETHPHVEVEGSNEPVEVTQPEPTLESISALDILAQIGQALQDA